METDLPRSFAALLKASRLARGLTQEALAEAAGLSRDAISLLERGARRSPHRDTVALLARTLQLSSDERARLLAAATAGRTTSAAAPPRASASASALPARLTSFIGREREIAEVRELLQSRRLVTLSGPGGIGKTSLALVVAGEGQGEFADGVALVELAALTDGQLIPQMLAAAVGVHERPGEAILTTLCRSLWTSQRLLLLDNCEHLALSCAQLAEALLQACPHLRILATSREPLRIGAETIWRVPPLTLPEDGKWPPEELARSEAVRLFVDRAGAVQPGFTLGERNAAVVGEICRQLDGSPLAIELAAARVAALSPEQIARHLSDRFRLLTSRRRTAAPRHRTLRAMIDWSHDLLSDEERLLLRRLAVFTGSWTLEAAEAACSAEVVRDQVVGAGGGEGTSSPDTSFEVVDLLTSLVEKSLVVADSPSSGETRYRLLWTIREYGRERLAAAGEADLLAGRHAAYYLAYAEEWGAADPTTRQGEAFARLDLEQDNLRQAVHWWTSRDIECTLRLVTALGYCWWRRRRLTELRRWQAGLLPFRQVLSRKAVLARFLKQAGECLDDRDLATRRALFEESLAIGREVGDQQSVGNALWLLAGDVALAGDHAAARALYAECLAQADAELQARTLVTLGNLARKTGDVAQARRLLEEAIARARQTRIPTVVGWSLDGLGKLERIQGNLTRAVELSEESLAAYQAAGDDNMVPWMDHSLGRLARLQGHYPRARTLEERALVVARQIPRPPLEAEALQEMGLIASAEGNLTGACRCLDEALAITRDGMRWETAELIASLGLVARAEGKLGEARRLFDEALTLWREVGNPHGVAVVTGHLGVVALQEGNLARAHDLFGESLTVRHAAGDQGGTATLLECFAGLAALTDEPGRAFHLLGAADRIRFAVGNPAPPIWRKQRDAWIDPAARALDDASRLAAYVAGQTTGWEGIIPAALPRGQRI